MSTTTTMKRPKVLVWIPAAESPRWPCVMSWLKMEDAGCDLDFIRSGANNIKYSWNKVVLDFLESEGDWLFSCHNDIVYAPATLPRLMSWNKPLVSALVFMRKSPVMPHIWLAYSDTHEQPYALRIQETYQWFMAHPKDIRFDSFVMVPRPDDALQEIDFTSTSCVLIRRSVLEAMRERVKDEWFRWDNDFSGGGEDRNFFENARAVGFPAYVDRSCIVGHLMGDVQTSSADFIAWSSVSNFGGTE